MSEILRLAGAADIDLLLPFMREYCEFDGLDHDPARARRTMLALLEVRRDNLEAQRYYERLGFERGDRYFLLARRL